MRERHLFLWSMTGASFLCMMAAVFSLALTPPKLTGQVISLPVFSDVDASTLQGRAALDMASRGIMTGISDGIFGGEVSLNRAQAAKILLLASGRPSEANLPSEGSFRDLQRGEWYVPYIVSAIMQGVLAGYPDGAFRPEQTVNTAEFLKMITLAFREKTDIPHAFADVDRGQWYAPYAGVAHVYTLFPSRGRFLEPARTLTRYDVALAVSQYLRMNEGVARPVPVVPTAPVSAPAVPTSQQEIILAQCTGDYICTAQRQGDQCAQFSDASCPQGFHVDCRNACGDRSCMGQCCRCARDGTEQQGQVASQGQATNQPASQEPIFVLPPSSLPGNQTTSQPGTQTTSKPPTPASQPASPTANQPASQASASRGMEDVRFVPPTFTLPPVFSTVGSQENVQHLLESSPGGNCAVGTCNARPGLNDLWCATSIFPCPAGQISRCEGECGTDKCQGKCCTCVDIPVDGSAGTGIPEPPPVSTSPNRVACPESFHCLAVQEGDRCYAWQLDCASGFILECQESCGEHFNGISCTGSCCRCVPSEESDTQDR